LFKRFGLGGKDRYPGTPIRDYGSIRVLKLKSIVGDRIACKLKIIDVASRTVEVPSYHALSYRWGDTADPRLIYCNGVPFTVQFNLYHALLQVWTKDPKIQLWVDAICIDQNNFTKLSGQV
jgi:hypothetical protein